MPIRRYKELTDLLENPIDAMNGINSKVEGRFLHAMMKRRVVTYLKGDLSKVRREKALVILGILSKMEGCFSQDIYSMREDVGVYVWELEKRLGLVRPLRVNRHA